MSNLNYLSDNEVNEVYLKINEQFKLNIDMQLKGSGYRFNCFYEVYDLVNDVRFYTVGIDNTKLNFINRETLIKLLIKFIDKQIANIPSELADLESERSSRDFNDYRHFQDTEALSAKEGNLYKIKSKLLKELNKKPKK